FAQRGASLELFEREISGTIANVAGKNVAAKSAEPLAMDNVKAAANLETSRQREREHRGQSVCPPGGGTVKADGGCAIQLNSVGKDVDLVLFCEARRQFSHIATVSPGPVIVVYDKSDFHALPALANSLGTA